MTKPRRRKASFLNLGEFNKEFNGWILNKNGICSPEGEVFDVPRLRYFHWQGQILSILRYRMNRPEQYKLFD